MSRSPARWTRPDRPRPAPVRRASILLLVLTGFLGPEASRAASVVDIQPRAVAGEDAPDATAVAITADPTNHAEAIGGQGFSTLTSPSQGGDATAIAGTATAGAAQATAVARGGLSYGAGGGGDATASASASNDTAAPVGVSAIASGGGANPSSLAPLAGGGDATVDAFAESTADGASIEIGVLRVQGSQAGAIGGEGELTSFSASDPPGRGGDAASRSVAIARGDSRVQVIDRARGGSAIRGQGGDATSYAEGSNQGSESVSVEAYATSGRGRIAGQASARARGVSGGGGDVSVLAVQNASFENTTSTGGVSVQRDAVSGGTSGRLVLEQSATGTTSPQAAGDVVSALSAWNELGGDLVATVRAIAGNLLDAATGNGGSAVIERLDFTGSEGRNVQLVGEATGGFASGTDASRGGDASITSQIVDSRAATVALEARATAGNGSGASVNDSRGQRRSNGGHASIDSAVDTRSDTLDLDLSSIAGSGGGLGQSAGDGGNATIHAIASNATGSASLVAYARGGQAGAATGSAGASGVRAGRGGDASVDVDVSTEGDGSAITIGLAPGFPSPASGAWGSSGSSIATSLPEASDARGGDATSRSVARAAGESDVTVYDFAQAGAAGGVAVGGVARSSARGESEGGDVLVRAEARAGRSHLSQPGSAALLGEVQGRSTTGDVLVVGRAVGGEGGNGADVELVDAVRGDTAGHLTLAQFAIAGSAHFQSTLAGRGGSARSELHHVGSSSAVSVDAEASGNVGSIGGTGSAVIRVENLGGRVDARALARGADSRRAAGGAATTRVDVHALGEVEVGAASWGDDPYEGTYGADGGEGGFVAGASGLDGGAADSRSTGRSDTGAVRVFDAARGGDAFAGSFASVPEDTRPADGGAARSFAEAAGTGASQPVLARSIAVGGTGGQLYADAPNGNAFGRGGSATAESHATGLDLARAEARALAGYFAAPRAIAQASAHGARSEVEATAQSQNHFLLRGATVSMQAAIDGGSVLARSAAVDAADAVLPWPALEGNPTPVAEASARLVLAGVDAVRAPAAATSSDNVRSIAELDFGAAGAAGTFGSRADLLLTSTQVHAFSNLQITLSDGAGRGTLESLRIQVFQGSVTFLDRTYDELADALSVFDDTAVALDGFVQVPDFAWYRTNLPITIALDWSSDDPDFAFSGHALLATVVPEPGTALLVGLGLAALARRETYSAQATRLRSSCRG
ncbi:MAG: PEP-CTERM sorting domain-containing protein [Myxococcota bacterium]